MNDHKIELKGGVIIIGSLLWEDDLDKGDNLRNNWRVNSLDLQGKILVKLPIRYGRYSNGNIYTMVFSLNCEKNNKLGTGYIIPFKQNTIKHLDILVSEARKMSEAEGMKKKLIGGNQNIWGSMAILINKEKIENNLAKEILKKWSTVFKADGGGQDNLDYRVGREKLSITKNGELQIQWPRAVRPQDNVKVDEFDFLLATSPKPKYEAPGKIKYPSATEIAKSVKHDTNRHYFLNNFMNNITTFQDNMILNLLK